MMSSRSKVAFAASAVCIVAGWLMTLLLYRTASSSEIGDFHKTSQIVGPEFGAVMFWAGILLLFFAIGSTIHDRCRTDREPPTINPH